MNKHAYILGYFKIAAEGYDFRDLAREYVKQKKVPRSEWAKTMNEMKEKWSEQQRVDMARKLGVWNARGPRYAGEAGRTGARTAQEWDDIWNAFRKKWAEDEAKMERAMKTVRYGGTAAMAGIGAFAEGLRHPTSISPMNKDKLVRKALKRSRQETYLQRMPGGATASGLGFYLMTHPKVPWYVGLPTGLAGSLVADKVNQRILDKKYKSVYDELNGKLPKAACTSE